MAHEQQIRAQLVGALAAQLADVLGSARFELVESGAEVIVGDAAALAPLFPSAAPLVGVLGSGEMPAPFLAAAVRDLRDLAPLLRTLALARRERDPLPSAADDGSTPLHRFEEVFSHVGDGMAVLDEQGRVLLLNPSGAVTLDVAAEEARGLTLAELVAPESAMSAALLLRELWRGGRVLSADLQLVSRKGRKLVLSVSAGQLRTQSGRAILSFRDVTEGRELEAELRQTKEFLERLIDATVDGIVAADLRGRILLFNKGAERVTGYSASEVIGKMSVLRFYTPGVAKSVMAQLRSGEETRFLRTDLVARGGELVPVSLSAALVREGGRESATVAVFSDLRERLRVEAVLQETQARLQVAEKAALVSELAGAAAHELNQPLTSVLGFSELLFRRTGEDSVGREELGAILREAERMASIVRKIGKIARYETTEYVGKKRIVDLERASEPPKPKTNS